MVNNFVSLCIMMFLLLPKAKQLNVCSNSKSHSRNDDNKIVLKLELSCYQLSLLVTNGCLNSAMVGVGHCRERKIN